MGGGVVAVEGLPGHAALGSVVRFDCGQHGVLLAMREPGELFVCGVTRVEHMKKCWWWGLGVGSCACVLSGLLLFFFFGVQ